MLEKQEESRNAAIRLVEKLEVFIQINDEYPGLHQKGPAGVAIDNMISLIKGFTEFVIQVSTKKGE